MKKAIDEQDVKALASPERWGQELLGEAPSDAGALCAAVVLSRREWGGYAVTYPYEGMEFGTISMRMVLIENGKE